MTVPSKKSFIAIVTALTLFVSLAVYLTQPGSTMQYKSPAVRLQPSELVLLSKVQEQGINYFIENQLPNGLVLDRQANRGAKRSGIPISTSATGMGLMAIAIASSPEHHMLSHADAVSRVRTALETSLTLRNDHGMMPHFVDPTTLKSVNHAGREHKAFKIKRKPRKDQGITPSVNKGAPQAVGNDAISTIDSSWLIAGALWSAEYLDDSELKSLAAQLEQRVDWQYWSTQTKDGLQLSMGADENGVKLPVTYDRYNAECVVLYMLAIGANNGHALPADTWYKLAPKDGIVGGIHITDKDLGLFTFQFGGALVDFNRLPLYGMPDLSREATKAAVANFVVCQRASDKYHTYEQFWGLSAGDGPPDTPGGPDAYRAYSPEQFDGTAHITATIASINEVPDLVLANLQAAEALKQLNPHGYYGYSNINVDKNWVSQDVVGIDMGAEVMALENRLHNDRMRTIWHRLPVMRRALRRLRALK